MMIANYNQYRQELTKTNSGFVVASLLITVTLLVLMGTFIFQLIINNHTLASQELYRVNAQQAADAGVDRSIAELNETASWTGTGGEVDFLIGADFKTTYEVSVSDNATTGYKDIVVTGRTYSPITAGSPISARQFTVGAEGLSPSQGTFSVVTGVGGLIMENNSKIVAGDVFVNGEIMMKNSAQIGLSTAPVTVESAHQNCPVGGGADYPRLCEQSEGEPIVMENPAHIYADISANNQTTTTGFSDNGLVLAPVINDHTAPPANYVAPQALPTHDRAAQQAAVSTTFNGSVNCDSNSAVLNWPANYRITGDVILKKKCKVNINGDVWIEGKLEMSTKAQLIVADSVGASMPDIMLDHQDGLLMQNQAAVLSNASNTGVQFLTYYSKASCSPDCATVTGSDLYDSRHEASILLKNSATAPDSILYARWSQVHIENSGDIGAIVGQTVKLQNSATITFGAAAGGGGGSIPTTFVIRDYRRTFN